MSVQQVRLESVRRKSGGRIPLPPRVPKSGPVTTLCGQTLAAGTFGAVHDLADCTNCQRRSKDQGRISGAFFAQEEGSELLRLSLEQARARKVPPSSSPPRLTVVQPVAWPAPQHVARAGTRSPGRPPRRRPRRPRTGSASWSRAASNRRAKASGAARAV